MDNNNWRPTQSGGEPAMDAGGDWRSQLQADSRQRIVTKIMDTLKRHLPFSGQEGLQELEKIAVRFEEKIYTAATSQSDYLRKISLKMLTMETKNPMPNAMQSNSSNNGQNPPDPGSQNMQSQLNSQAPPLSVPVQSNLTQSGQLLTQNIANNIGSGGMQGSASLTSSLPPVGSLPQTNIPNVVNQNNNMQNIPNISGVVQNSVGSAIGQGVPSNMFGNSQRQMQGRQQQGVPQQQPQQQSQSSQQSLYQQHLKQKFQSGAISQSQMQSHLQQLQQQQQQQNLLQSNQLHSSQQSVMQPSMMQSAPLSSLQQNQQSSAQQSTQSVLQQHPQALRQRQQQASNIHQQQPSLPQQAILPTQQQQQQHLVGQSNNTNIQQNQLIGQQNSIPDMQQQQRLIGQQNNLSNQQQQLIGLPNNLPHMHQQQLGPQGGVGGLQQQQQQHHQLLGAQSGTSVMPNNQHSVHMLQPKVPMQQSQQSMSNLLPSQGQQSQQQSQQQMMSNLLPNQSQTQQQSQQMMSQIQSQPGQLHKQLGLQQQPNPLQRDMQQRLQTPGTLLQQQNLIDQKQVFQPQRAMPEASSTSQDSTANGGDWQEEIYQKIKAMKDMYFLDLNDMYQKIAAKLHQNESLLQQQPHMQQGKNPQLEKLKAFKSMLERFISLLQVSKSNIQIGYKDKLGSYEKQIMSILNSNRPRKPIPPMQQGQALPPQHMHPMQQSQPPQSQMNQLQPLENQMNSQMQSLNLPGSGGTMQQKSIASLHHNPSSPVSGLPNTQQNMINSLQPSSALDPGQSNSMNSMQQVASGSLQQNHASGPQQANANLMTSQSGMNSLQTNHNSMQPGSNMLQQQQHLKQQEQLLQSQQMKQMQQRQMQQIAIQKQIMQQQQQFQQTKLQQPAQMQSNQSPHLHQMSDSTDLKIRQMGAKSGAFQQQHSASQRSAYQQLKPGNQFHISSPQLLQPASPQISQHASPQIDQQNMLSALTKNGTPLQSVNSPFIVPSPSTPSVPSPMPGESEKVNSGVSTLSNPGNIGQHQTAGSLVPAQSLAIGTPGISASPLLAEFTSPEGHHAVPATVVPGKSNATEQPIERLLKVMKSMSSDALTASVRDIGSVVSMIDRVAGSAPGNGSRAAVGEDLVAMTKCRLQARNFISQDGTTGTKKMKRYTTAMPSDVVSSTGSMTDSFKPFHGSELSDLESTATSIAKKPRNEANLALFEEIKEINQRLIDTVVDISDEDVDPTATATAATIEVGEGTIVKCSYSAVALSPNLKSQYASSQMSPIQPLRLLVPKNYPNCSPVLLDKFPTEDSKDYEDLSMKARSRFSTSLRTLSQPLSIGDIAKTWDRCARAVISDYAQQSGGGTFSSKYGTWEDCLTI
ncbi:mediator of RNA polymerase II transcription subunit 15a [Daucus carota subsp. sativus]|uniref:mediator of RNA polymerase II transcription subunit 15a n=1 Tax=Daucus carota subsp. sativus TaxID=79200 RepID=UPI0007EF0609|nr:PREDICTED: mediator of RNA polymerase II transcription subunit 15a [Daucus carota subsp. sativus]XP_017225459.1 PREDICTED: mediator of RNA polymerase II transcription subunit 15a [Daucus carota subsp. sativus]